MLKVPFNDLSHQEKKDIIEMEELFFGIALDEIYVNDDDIKFLLIKKREHVIAYLAYKDYGKAINIFNIAVQNNFQNQSLATKLIRNIQVKDVILEVEKGNRKAFDLYKKLGFIVFKEDNKNFRMIWSENDN